MDRFVYLCLFPGTSGGGRRLTCFPLLVVLVSVAVCVAWSVSPHTAPRDRAGETRTDRWPEEWNTHTSSQTDHTDRRKTEGIQDKTTKN